MNGKQIIIMVTMYSSYYESLNGNSVINKTLSPDEVAFNKSFFQLPIVRKSYQ